MLQHIRNKAQGVVAWMIVAMVAGALIIGSIGTYFGSGKSNQVAAKVNGQSITWQDVYTFSDRIMRMQHKTERQLTPAQEAQLLQETRLILVRQAAFMQGLTKEGFLPTTDQLSLVQTGLMGSYFSLPSEVSSVVSLLEQSRDIAFLILPKARFLSRKPLSQDSLEAYFQAHQDDYLAPAQAKIQYVTLSLADVLKEVQVSDEELKAYYEGNPNLFTIPPQAHIRHILIQAPRDAKPEQDAVAREKALALLKQIEQGGSFAEAARTQSQDTQSSAQGGDLGWIAEGEMMLPDFDQAIFSMQRPNEVAGPIRTPFGYHLVQLVARKEAQVRPFQEVKTQVKENLIRQRAEPLLDGRLERLAQLAEQNTDLKEIAKELHLSFAEAGPFTQEKGGDKSLTRNPVVLEAVFSTSLSKGDKNSEVLNTDDNSFAVIRVTDFAPERQLALTEVQDKVQLALQEQQAGERLQQKGEDLVKRLLAGEKPEEIAREFQVSWQQHPKVVRVNQHGLEPRIVQAAFKLARPTPAAPAVQGVWLDSGDYALVEVLAVKDGNSDKISKAQVQNYRNSLNDLASGLELETFVTYYINEADIEMKSALP